MIANVLNFSYVVQLKGSQVKLNAMIKKGLENAGNIPTEMIANSVTVIEQAIGCTLDSPPITKQEASTVCLENTANSPLVSEPEGKAISVAKQPLPLSFYEQSEKNHGRHSQWKVSVYEVSSIPDPQKILSLWTSIRTVICVHRIIEHTSPKNKKKDYNKKAYYISNHTNLSAEQFHKGIRGHWSIENGLHYEKDVVLNEDKNRIKNKAAAPIFSTFNTVAINFLRMLNFKGIRDATIKFGFNFKELLF